MPSVVCRKCGVATISGVDVSGANHLLGVAEDLQALRVVALQLLRRSAADRHEFAARDFAIEQIAGVMLADVAHPDNSHAHFVHAGRTLAE